VIAGAGVLLALPLALVLAAGARRPSGRE
jgi:hypothetical protein